MSAGPLKVQRQDVVLVSPMDVAAERDRVELVVTELNRTVAERLGCTLRLRRWETDSRPGLDAGGSQSQVEKGLHIPDADLVIGIFWRRLGTPVQGAGSGTESELRLAWSTWLRKGKPEVMLYFCERAFFPGSQAELDQLQSLLAFRKGLPKQQLHWAFRKADEFERMLREHLTDFVTSTNDPAKRRTSASQGQAVRALSTRVADMSRNVGQLSVTAHNLDMMYEVDLVEADHETVASHCSEEPGGSGANTSVAVAKLGCTASTTGIVADDPPGQALIEALRGTDNMQPEIKLVKAGRDISTGRTIVVSDRRGRRSIYVHPGVNEYWASMLTPVERNQLIHSASDAKIVHFTSFTGTEELALQTEVLRHLAAETVVSFNPGALYVQRPRAELQPFIDRMNVMTIYEAQLGVLVANLAKTSASRAAATQGDDAQSDLERLFSLRDQSVDQPLVVLVKRYRPLDSNDLPSGRMYALAVAGHTSVEEQVYPQPDRRPPADRWRMIDSTGAGDAMAAGLHVGLLCGADLQECVNIAFVMAMEVSNAAGARAGQPDLQRLRKAWELWFRSKPPMCLR